MPNKNRPASSKVTEKVSSFLTRELENLVAKAREKAKRNPFCYAQRNPANHSYDVPDGSYRVCFVKSMRHIDKACEDARESKGHWYRFKVVCRGRFSDLLSFIHGHAFLDVKRELAIAIFEAFCANLICNYPESRALQDNGSDTDDSNAFKCAVADAILSSFVDARLLK